MTSADKTLREGEVSETGLHRPEPLEETDTTGTEGGGAGGWSRPERVQPETRKKEEDDRDRK